MTAIFTDTYLFNCCSDGKSPDWKGYTRLVLDGCRDDSEPGDDSTYIVAGQPRDTAEFFAVYAFNQEGDADVITDVNSGWQDAVAIAGELSRLSGLPCETLC